MSIPEVSQDLANKPRKFRTELASQHYLRLEIEAMKRGLTAYKLAGAVLQAWLSGDLVRRVDPVDKGSAVAPSLSPSPSVAGREEP